MAQTFNLPARTLPLGDTVFGPFAIPVGTQKLSFNLDVTQMVAGQRVWMRLEYFDGSVWAAAITDFDGPWRDKQNVLHNDVTLLFDFGFVSINNGPYLPRVSAAGWQARVTLTVEGAPYSTSGGTLTLT
jgi:hypothetical protein